MFSVTCDQRALHEKVQLVARGVSGRSTQPIQNNVYLQAANGKLTLVATDLEYIGLKTEMEVDELEDGIITVPARIFTEVTGRLPSGPVTLRADDGNSVDISCGQTKFNIRGLPADDFEQLPELEDPIDIEMSQAGLLDVINRVVFATSSDETRPILTGALFRIKGGQLATVATDTYRLALVETQLGADVQRDLDAIVSRRALTEVQRVLSAGSSEPVHVRLSQNQVEFVVDGTVVSSRLIEGQFVNYPKVIPTGTDKKVIIDAAELSAALNRALVLARQDGYRVVLRAQGPELTISANSQDVGKVEEKINISMEGGDAEIAFNADFMLNMLNATSAKQIVMELSGPLNSGLLRPVGEENYVYVLMPMQIM